MNSQASATVQHYRRINTYGGIENADPHTLVGMLYEGLSEAIANAKGALERGDVAGKGQAVVRAVDILEGLRTSLDVSGGGEVAGNLERLYTYMQERLTQANLRNDVAVLDEVISINDTLRGAWTAIKPQPQQALA